MCFSAPVSFTASAVIGAIGVATLTNAKHKKEILFASVPLIFAFLQFTEGLVWLSFSEGGQSLFHIITIKVYDFMAVAFWPMYFPLAVYLLEPPSANQNKKKLMQALIIAGLAYGLYFIYLFITQNVIANQVCGSIHYEIIDYPAFLVIPLRIIYATVILLSIFLSSHRYLKIYGILITVSLLITLYFYYQVYFSIWCFFAAIISLTIYLFIKKGRTFSGELNPDWPKIKLTK